MKKIFTLLCAGFLGLTTLQAEVLLTEHFAQTTETLATNENAFAAEINSTGWTNINGSGQVYMNEADLIYNGYKSATDNTGSAEYKATFGKKVATPLSQNINTGSIYAAAIFNFTACSPTAGRDYLWAFSPDKSSISTAGNHFGRLCAQKSTNTFQLGIAKNAESAAFISYTGELAYGKYLIVMEYEFIDGEKNDIVRLYVNPVKGDKPAATIECKQHAENAGGTDVGSGTKDDPSQFASFMLYSTNTTKLACLIDELKVTTSWDDLWESGGASTDPAETIAVEKAVNFYEEDLYNNFYISTVFPNKEYKKEIEILAENLTEDITVSHKNSDISLSASTIDKEGGKLTITLNPSNISGNQVDTIVYSSGEATDTTFVAWGVNLQSYKDIASLKAAYASDNESGMYLFSGEAVITRTYSGAAYIQDATAAIRLSNEWGQADAFAKLLVGDKIGNFIGYAGEKDAAGIKDFIIGHDVLPISQNNIVEPQIITLAGLQANALDYLLEIVKIEDAELNQSNGTFQSASKVSFEQGNNSAFIQAINSSADYIGESIPAKADITGFSINQNGTVIVPRSKADIVSKEISTAIDNINSSSLQGGERGRLFLHNGQIIILRDNKTFNLLGTEIK